MSDETSKRRFILIDLMALIVAFATSLWILKARGYFEGRLTSAQLLTYGFYVGFGAFSILAPLTIATLGLRLRRPRPARRELLDQPGAVACFTAVAAILVTLAESCVRVWFDSVVREWGFTPNAGFVQVVLAEDAKILRRFFDVTGAMSGHLAGFGIAVSWALLVAGGRWRAEPSWIDRTGRVIGVAWVASAIYNTFIDHG